MGETAVEAYPLSWPAGWPRTPSHERGRAKFGVSRTTENGWRQKTEMTVSQAVTRLVVELGRAGVGIDVTVISTNVRTTIAGIPMSKQRVPDDPGVAVYFTMRNEPYCLPCDRWDRVADNLAAVAAHVEAMRGMERWGVGSAAQHFAGFKALPAVGGTTVGAAGAAWFNVLGVQPTASADVVKAAYRALAAQNHPDRGGDAGAMAAINRAWEQAQASLDEMRRG